MHPVNRGEMRRRACLGHYEIDVLVLLAAFRSGNKLPEDACRHIHLGLLFRLFLCIEAAFLAVYGLLEDQWLAGVGRYHPVDERDQALADHRSKGIREGIEHKCVCIYVNQHVAVVILQEAAAAAAE